MTKNRQIRIAVVALAVALAASTTVLTACKKAETPTTPSVTTTTSTTTPGAAATGTPATQTQTSTLPTATSSAGTTKPGSSKNATGATTPDNSLGPFAELPDPGIAARKVTSPIAAGQKLPPLASAPSDTISGLKLGTVPDGSAYKVTLRPYGIGPSILMGSRLAVRVDAATPKNGAPTLSTIVNANLLVLVDTKHGGTITKGGTYSAWLVFLSDGSKLLPVMSRVTAVK